MNNAGHVFHRAVISFIPVRLWKSELDPNKVNDSLEDRKYLYSPMEYNNRIVPVKLTVMKYKDIKAKKRLYSIQAINANLE